jgi:dTDP-4-dehydrorhamnose reductase
MLEVWGGVECSIVRVNGVVRNQIIETGHYTRSEDLDLIAELGIRTLRYPTLWELVEPIEGHDDWVWLDHRLSRLRQLGISPVAGLLHHGSGPAWTHILSPNFPDQLAAFAARLARRYPWIRYFTPVAEPLTTARMGGLYGVWCPYASDEATCFRLIVAQCRAIAKAMAAIRGVIPQAQLVQTEDIGRTFATPELQYQADYENSRRWLSMDLLCGLVDACHPFHARLIASGVDPVHLSELTTEPCGPDLVGIDYYLTSDRFLDHRTERHRGETVGGNGVDTYVDIAAARSEISFAGVGLMPRLKEVWERYWRPIVVAELHNGCTRDEQLRWFVEGWQVAKDCLASGVDVRGVTAWSLFGAVDWNSLMVRRDGYYECGVFDVRASPPRRTVLADAISAFNAGRSFYHPVLEETGWWRAPLKPVYVKSKLIVRGSDRRISDLSKCCSKRRIVAAVCRGRETALSDKNPWVEITVVPRSHYNRHSETVLNARYADGGKLSVEIADQCDWVASCNAFLDLVVDKAEGRFALLEVGGANQYHLAELAALSGQTASHQKV